MIRKLDLVKTKGNFSKLSRVTLCLIVLAVVFAGAAVVIKWSFFMGASTSSNNMSPPIVVPAKEKATASVSRFFWFY